MPSEVIYADQRQSFGKAQYLGAHDAGQYAAHQSWASGYGDCVNLIECYVCLIKGIFYGEIDFFGMGARSNFWHDTTECGVGFRLAKNHIRYHTRIVRISTNHRRRCIVTAAFDTEDGDRFGHMLGSLGLRLG
jgi:hypothetical protein